VEDDDVTRQLLVGEAGDAAGLFERCQSVSSPGRSEASLAAGSVGPVEPEPVDLGGDRRRNQAVDRLAARDPRTDVGRRHVERLDLEEADAVWTLQFREHVLEAALWVAGPGCNAEPGQL